MSVIKDCVTNKDGDSYCPIRIMMVLSFLVVTLCTVADMAMGYMAYFYALQHAAAQLPAVPRFDATSYGTSVAAISAGGGGGILLKKTTEPDA